MDRVISGAASGRPTNAPSLIRTPDGVGLFHRD